MDASYGLKVQFDTIHGLSMKYDVSNDVLVMTKVVLEFAYVVTL